MSCGLVNTSEQSCPTLPFDDRPLSLVKNPVFFHSGLEVRSPTLWLSLFVFFYLYIPVILLSLTPLDYLDPQSRLQVSYSPNDSWSHRPHCTSCLLTIGYTDLSLYTAIPPVSLRLWSGTSWNIRYCQRYQTYTRGFKYTIFGLGLRCHNPSLRITLHKFSTPETGTLT